MASMRPLPQSTLNIGNIFIGAIGNAVHANFIPLASLLNKGVSQFYHYRLTGNFAYQALKWLDLEVHYSYIYTKPYRSRRFFNRQRLELEANPSLRLSNGISFKLRYSLRGHQKAAYRPDSL